MLPFTKRPGRDNESGDVVTKEDLEDPPTSLAKRSVPPPAASERPRKLMPSLSDDELTALMPSKSVGTINGLGNPIPAAGRPATVPPPARASVPPPGRSARAVPKFDDDDDGEGRTQVRGAPKVVRRANNSQPPPKMGMPTAPTTISPAAVIKATLDSARAGKRNDIMAGPPIDLLEDRADVHPADAGPQRTVQMDSSQSGNVPVLGAQIGTQALAPQPVQPIQGVQAIQRIPAAPASYPGANSAFPPPPASYPPPPMSYPQGVAYGSAAASASVPGVSIPPHFMVPHAPYSDGRVDPPATALTSSSRAAGRPAMSWAAALLAFGLFVGVGAVAVMQRGNDGVVDTTASFVDPSRAPGTNNARPAAAPPPEAPKPAEPAATTTAAPVAAPPPVTPDPNAPPPVAAAQPATPPAAQPATTSGAVIGVSTPAPSASVAAHTEAAAKPADPPKPVAAPQPVATFKPPPRTWSPPPSPAPKPAADDDAPKKTAASTPKKGGAKGGDDDEMKKALEQLQKSQLEQSLKE